MDVPLNDDWAVQRDARRWQRCIECPAAVGKHRLVMRVGLAQSHRERSCFASTTGPACPLEIIGWVRRHVVHRYRADAANVDAHLHGGGAGQEIESYRLERLFVAIEGAR